MKKMCVMLAMAICFGFTGCKKSTPAEQKPAASAVEQTKAVAEQAAPAVQEKVAEVQKSAEETAQKSAEAAQPAVEQAKEALTSAAAEVDLTSPLEKLKEQAKSMNVDTLKAMAEKYKAQYLSTQSKLASTQEVLSKLVKEGKIGPEIQGLAKDVESLNTTLASLKERMMVYMDVLKAQGIDISGFAIE